MSLISSEKRTKIFQNALSNLEECTEFIGQYFSGEEKEEQLQIMEELAKEYHGIETKRNLNKKALDLTEAYFNNKKNDGTVNVEDVWKQNIEKCVSSIIPFKKHPDMTKIIIALEKSQSRPSTSQSAVTVKTEPADV